MFSWSYYPFLTLWNSAIRTYSRPTLSCRFFLHYRNVKPFARPCNCPSLKIYFWVTRPLHLQQLLREKISCLLTTSSVPPTCHCPLDITLPVQYFLLIVRKKLFHCWLCIHPSKRKL